MKTKSLVIGLACFTVVALVLSMSTNSQKTKEQPKFDIIEIATGAGPRWSPDGTKLAFVSGGCLCVADADGAGEIQRIIERRLWSFDWTSDSTFVVSEKMPWAPPGKGRGHKFIIEMVDMRGAVEIVVEDSIPGLPALYDFSYLGAPFVLRDGTVGYYEVHEHLDEKTRIFKIIKQGKIKAEEAGEKMRAFVKPYPDGDIWLESLNGRVKTRLTEKEKWSFPELSPDSSRILAFNLRGEMIVLDLEGDMVANLGIGYPARWSPDSEKIVFSLQEESHYDIVASELYIINADGTGRIQITDTPDEIETGPSWSPDGNKIACGSHNSGKIFVIKLNQK
jgi:Tol biopolymer transport system component